MNKVKEDSKKSAISYVKLSKDWKQAGRIYPKGFIITVRPARAAEMVKNGSGVEVPYKEYYGVTQSPKGKHQRKRDIS